MLKAIIETMNSYYFDNELGYHRRKKIQNSFIVTLLVITWYVSAVVAVTTSKEIMNNIKFPFFLCTTQFTFASILSAAYLKLSGSFVPLQTSINSLVIQISVGYTFGFVLTNIAFSIGKSMLRNSCATLIFHCCISAETTCALKHSCLIQTLLLLSSQ